MPSSPIEQTTIALDDVRAIAARLLGERVIGVVHCGGGGNNRVYRVQTRQATFALKSYGSVELDRDRLAHEFDGLRFLKASGAGGALPEPIAVDRISRFALYEWIEGSVPARHGAADVAAVIELLGALHRARNAKGASDLPAATPHRPAPAVRPPALTKDRELRSKRPLAPVAYSPTTAF